MLTNSSGVNIPLSAVAKIETSLGASSIAREMNRRHLTVRLNLRGRDLTSFLNEAQSKIESDIPFDHTKNQIRWDGQFENQNRAYARLAIIIPFVLAFMFLLLYGAFGEFRQAGLLIAMLPLALLGGLLALRSRYDIQRIFCRRLYCPVRIDDTERCHHDITYQRPTQGRATFG